MIGQMRSRVTIQRLPSPGEADAYGHRRPDWQDVDTVWARVEALSGRELWQAQQARPDVTHRITLRYFEGLTPQHRLKVGGRVFNLETVIPDERKSFHTCTAREVL